MLNSLKRSYLVYFIFLVPLFGLSQIQSSIAPHQLEKLLQKEDLRPSDLNHLKISSAHKSSASGLTHIYLQQYFESIPISGGVASFHLEESGKIFHLTNNLIGNINEKINKTKPTLTSLQAIEKTTAYLKNRTPLLNESRVITGAISKRIKISDIIATSAKLVFEVISDDKLCLSWMLEATIDDSVYKIIVDAETGTILKIQSRTLNCAFKHKDISHVCIAHPSNRFPKPLKTTAEAKMKSPASDFLNITATTGTFPGQYFILPRTTESPLYGTRSLKTGCELIDPTASPHGWHDTDGDVNTIEYDYTRSNNVYAFYAQQGTAPEPAPQKITRVAATGTYAFGNVPIPASSSLNFDYQNSLVSVDATDFLEDAVTNLFVMNNICHDVFFHYGFDESAGNFQETNYTGTGTGNDELLARAQDEDGAVFNQASFTPTAEGTKPSMRMHLWTTGAPNQIASDFDNLIIAHEYGHGVSFRLVGGAANINCLSNFEQGGEGWSDYFGLMLTMKDHNGNGIIDENSLGEGIRGVGAYVLNENMNGEGFRPRYYTYNMNENTTNFNEFTYGGVNDLVFPHGVGFLWCTMLWDMTLKLMEVHGFHENIYDETNAAGNIRALKIVIEALKMTPCEPSFVDMRDAIIAANSTLYGGENEDLIWAVFARRGLGFSATTGGNEAFDSPSILVTKTVDKTEAQIGDDVTYTIKVKNNAPIALSTINITDTYPTGLTINSISNGGNVSGNTVNWAVSSLPIGNEITRTFTSTITASSGTTTLLDEPVETNSPPGFVPAGSWLVNEDPSAANSNNPNSTRYWFHPSPPNAIESSLILNLTLPSNNDKHLSFWHYFNVESTFDGGVIEILNGGTWEDLGPKMIQNGYNSFILDAVPTPIGIPVSTSSLSGQKAFTGYSGDYIQTIIDLSDYADNIQLRFRFVSNAQTSDANCHNNFCEGWLLDDFKVYDLEHLLNEACATSSQGFNDCGNVGEVGTIYFSNALPVELLNFSATPDRDKIILKWQTVSETNNAGFYLQRRTANSSFENIAWINGQINNFEIANYEYADKNVDDNIQYFYRLQQVDLTGETEFSKIVDATLLNDALNNSNEFHIHPNPVEDILTIEWNKNIEITNLELLNVQGQVLNNYKINNGEFQAKIDVSKLPSEIYFLRLITNHQIITKRFLKR